ncbi:hypothetical protein [Methylocystis sp.]|uniref:hypothetical protein n=1 Tax=Methylocystis sp. TaxID=1911079 RepID=UPI003DA491C1
MRRTPLLRGGCVQACDISGMIAGDSALVREGVRGPRRARQKKREHQRANGRDGECRVEFPTHGAQL